LNSLGFTCKAHGVESVDLLLEQFALHVNDYKTKRDIIDTSYTSGLSVHLRFGTFGIRELLRWLVQRKKEGIDTEPFFRQLVFREFYASLLYHFPHVAQRNFKYRFNGVEDKKKFQLFCEGATGVPIVDAGVQQLLKTGKMHNRVRMICASFLTKDLLLPWQWGERFFALHLLDFDAASNLLSWQWSAGTGVDPQPYFRIFNPYLQAKKFDKDAIYIKKMASTALTCKRSRSP
jgi:deoxyribodipyrimidine photo-lyase